MNQPTVLSKTPVPNYTTEEPEFVRLRLDDGYNVYQNAYGHPVHVAEMELEILVKGWIGQIRAMIGMLEEDAYMAFGQNVETLLNAFERHMDEVFEAVYREIGQIICHEVASTPMDYRQGRVVGLELKREAKGGC